MASTFRGLTKVIARHGLPSSFVPFVGEFDNTLCIQVERVVAHDNTVRYDHQVL